MHEKLSKLQKMYGELILVTFTTILIVKYLSDIGTNYYYNKMHDKTEGIRFNEDDQSAIIAPYIIGVFIWGIYCIVWYIRIYYQSLYIDEGEKKSYKYTIYIGCLPVVVFAILLFIMFRIFSGLG